MNQTKKVHSQKQRTKPVQKSGEDTFSKKENLKVVENKGTKEFENPERKSKPEDFSNKESSEDLYKKESHVDTPNQNLRDDDLYDQSIESENPKSDAGENIPAERRAS